MKKKIQPMVEPIVPQQIRELAKQSVQSDKIPRPRVCGVCRSHYLPASGPQPTEDLCWVCRRLKISAWRDSDQQPSVQE
jgi:hypothetical protein